MQSPDTLPLLAVLVVAVLTAGCAGIVGSDEEVGDDLQAELNETEPPETVSATVETTVSIDGESGPKTITENVRIRADGTSRTDGVGEESYVLINDGERVWQQGPDGKNVTYYERGNTDQSRLERIYEEQRDYFDRFEVASLEKSTVDDRSTHHVVFEQPDNETVERSIDVMVDETTYQLPLETSLEAESGYVERIELRLDEETLFPLEYRMETNTSSFEITYTDVTFNEEFDDELFEPPTEDEEYDEIVLPEIEYYDSIDETATDVEFEVSTPDLEVVPERFEHDTVRVTTYPDEDRTQVTSFYRDGDASIHVATADGPREFPAAGETVSVGGIDASVEVTDRGTELDWERNGTYHHVYADESLDRHDVLEIAESIVDDSG